MSRIIANLLLILIIAFTASAVPINTDLLNLNITLPEPKENATSEEETVPADSDYKLSFVTQEHDYTYNPDRIDLTFSGIEMLAQAYAPNANQSPENPSTDSSDSIESFVEASIDDLLAGMQLEVFRAKEVQQESIVKRIEGADFLALCTTEIEGDTLILHITADQNTLGLHDGHYILSIESNSDRLSETFTSLHEITYYGLNDYKSTRGEATSGNRLMTLFFTDAKKNYLVPVSREVKYSGNLIRTTLNALRDGPSTDSGLSATSPAPYVPAARFSTQTEVVSLETDSYYNQDFTQTEDDTYLMMHSLIDTMTHIQNVSYVKFSVDKKDNKPLNGFDLSKSYPRPQDVNAYLALGTDVNRLYLVPVDTNAVSAQELFKVLKYGTSEDDLLAPVPPEVELISDSLSDGVLTLTLSNHAKHAYNENETYGKLMMDSIVQSMASLPDVEQIVLKTEASSDKTSSNETTEEGTLFDYLLGTVFTPDRYLNME